MSEYREALAKLLLRIDGLPESHFAVIFEWPQYKSAKALLARGEPEQGEMSEADVRRHYNTACDVFGIGSEARKSGYVLSTNCENAKRRSDCLSLIEREFFTSIEQDEEGEEGECVENCELPWGAEPDRYVKKFGELLAARVEPAAAEKARERYQEGDVLLFIGWLSGDIAELRKVEVPRLADSWRRFKEALTSPPRCDRRDRMSRHELQGGTLTRETGGIVARCTCGWSSGGHFSSLAASAHFRDHQDEQLRRDRAQREGSRP